MPLTKATYSMIQGACVNVLDKGADPSGATSSVVAIKAAITEAITNGQSVYFPAGEYLWDDASFYTIQPLVDKSLILFGEGKASVVRVAQNNTIFNVICSDISRFFCKDMYFVVDDPVTDSNVTMFYFTNGTFYGAYFGLENLVISGASTCVHGIRAGGAYAKNCNFYGTGITNGSACVRMWGADGTATVQDHSFSNFLVFEQCNFNNATYGVQGYGIAGSTFVDCVFQGLNIGIANVSNSDGVGGVVSSTTRSGYGIANFDIANCWFEQNGLSHMVNNDVDYLTGIPIPGSVYQGLSQITVVGSQYFDPETLFLDPKLVNGTPVTQFSTLLQNSLLSVTVALGSVETRDVILGGNPGVDIQNTVGALISVSGYGATGTGTLNALWQVGGFLNDAGNTRITQIINAADAGLAVSAAYQAAGTVRLTFTNTSLQQQIYKVSVMLNKSVVS
jgi:hypothetical protein